MPLPELLAALEREAQASETSELKRAEAEAERLRLLAAGEGTARMQERLAEYARALRASAEESLVVARRQGEARVLKARTEFLDQVFKGALALEGDVRGWATYRAALERDVRTLLGLISGEEVTLRCAPEDRAAVAAAAGTGANVEPTPEVTAGVRAATADGRMEMDCTLAARLVGARPALAIRLVQRVEGG